jgi:hypothetical protein
MSKLEVLEALVKAFDALMDTVEIELTGSVCEKAASVARKMSRKELRKASPAVKMFVAGISS